MIAARISAVALPLLILAGAACGGSNDRAADSVAASDSAATPTVAAAPSDTTTVASGGETAVQGALLDPNTATREQLVAVPGVAGHVADAIIAGRPYTDMRDVNKVLLTHAPDSTVRKGIYAKVWKPIDLNTATDEEILLIPGVGRRMLHDDRPVIPRSGSDEGSRIRHT